MAALHLALEREHPAAVVILSGQMDGSSANLFSAFLADHLPDDEQCIVLDATRLTFISSAGLRELMLLLKRLAKHKARPAIFGMTPPVALAMEIAGFDVLFTRATDRAAAVKAVTPVAPEKPGLFSRLFKRSDS
jgi:stage II sporulation protein AA (anti-sigma F factor antagonist)